MNYLDKELIHTHKTYESILSLPSAPLITRGKQGKKNEDRLAFIEALDKSGVIFDKAAFPNGFDPLKEYGDFGLLDFSTLLELLSAYHKTAKKESDIFDAGLYTKNIKFILDALKSQAKYFVLHENDEDVRTYAFVDRGMMDTDLVMEAFEIALEAFKGAVDKGGMPYVYHPIRVALRCKTEEAIAAALLHDVLEDCSDMFSRKTLEERGITKEVLDAVELLTHEDGVPYLAYVLEISKNPIASQVKWGDLMDNLNKSRNGNKHSRKSLYYFKSLSLIEKAMNEEDEDSLYYYYQEEDVFIKKTKHGNFALDEGRFVHCPYKIEEDLFELTFYPDDDCLKDDCLPYFHHGEVNLYEE